MHCEPALESSPNPQAPRPVAALLNARRACWSGLVAAALALLAPPASAGDAEVVDIHRTQHGVVHIEADTEFALAYGLGHAYASDNVCLLADFVVTVNGERSRYFGAAARTLVGFEETDNLTSDFFFGYYIGDAALREAYRDVQGPARELIRGFVAGYNAYLRETSPAALPAGCRNEPWVRPITEMDMFRMLEERAILGSGSFLFAGLVAAAPPGVADEAPRTGQRINRELHLAGLGSNGWAFGAEATASRGGLLLANPHFPWETINRFYQIHLRLRGQFDAMGVTLPPFPAVVIGFNHDVAWTHTVSTAQRFTLFELTLAADDPRVYLLDGVRHRMTPRTVSVAVRQPDGRIGTRSHTFYETVHGPVVSLPGLQWDTRHAYALHDVNRGNTDMIATWLGIARARNVAEVRGALAARRGLGWINTIAADRDGAVLFADLSRVPNVSQALIGNCRASADAAGAAASEGIVLLDGAREACRWYSAGNRAAWLPVGDLPVVMRRDYVANSNDSYWLVNARSTQPALSPILGPAAVAQRLRTRIGLEMIEGRLGGESGKGGGRIRAQDLQAMLFSNRNYAGELSAGDVPALCKDRTSVALPDGRTVDLAEACSAIARWDRRNELDSRGAALFREFWRRARSVDDLYAEPFDPNDPIRTPRGLNLSDPRVRDALRSALAEAAVVLRSNGFALDARLGDLQGVVRNGHRIEIPGGDWYEGVLNQNMVRPLAPKTGYVPYDGSSYIQIVELGEDGPVAHGVLTYSQSVNPASPYYADQTELYSKERLYRLPFTDRQILADPLHSHERLSVSRDDSAAAERRSGVADPASRPARSQ